MDFSKSKKGSKTIADGLAQFYENEIEQERLARRNLAEAEIPFDERHISLKICSSAEGPALVPYFNAALEKLENDIKYEKTKSLPYFSKYSDLSIIQGKIELEKELRKLAFEELADVLRPYSTEGWITKQK